MARGRPRAFDRDDALRAAMLVFWEHGYEGTSMADLTQAMGINPPSLYGAFGSKERLYREAVAYYSATEDAQTRAALTEEPTARGAIEKVLRTKADAFTTGKKPRGCMVVLSAMNCTAEHDNIREFADGRRREDEGAIQDRLALGVAEGDLPPGTDVAAMAMFYCTVLFGLSVQARSGATREQLNTVVDNAMLVWEVHSAPATATR